MESPAVEDKCLVDGKPTTTVDDDSADKPYIKDDEKDHEPATQKEENDSDLVGLEDNSWIDELECALLADCDPITLKKISEGKRLPRSLRADFWKALLAITSSSKVSLSKEYDLVNQSQIRQDCERLVDELSCHGQNPSHYLAPISDTKKMALRSDLESTLTTYIKARPELQYVHANGWIDILRILYFLELNDVQLYQMFLRIVDRYIPKGLNKIDSKSVFQGEKDKQSNPTSIPQLDKTTTTTSDNIVSKSIQAYHLLRLLLLYHDPELCSILDSKKVTPDLYAKDWFCSLFARSCSTAITLIIWDTHFKMADPFLIFFAAIVMVVSASEDLKNQDLSQEIMIDSLSKVPKKLQEDDIDDLYYLVSSHYANFTPRSIRAYSHLFFMDTFSNTYLGADPDGQHTLIDVKTNQLTQKLDLSQYLCLPIVPAEIVIPLNTPVENRSHHSGEISYLDPQQSNVAILKYFLVDCRPAEQYNAGHLTRAFHLDCSLMLREPSAFSTAVQALLDIQRQIIASGSQKSGQHLCFIGSGRDEEDRYVNMVVASFLQKYQKYVSIVIGGFDAIHDFVNSKQELNNNFNRYIVDHNPSLCLTCQAAPEKFANIINSRSTTGTRGIASAQSLLASTTGFLKNYERNANLSSFTASLSSTSSFNQSGSILDKFTSAFVNKSSEIKEKFVESLSQPPGSVSASSARHVSQNDKLGKRYTGRQAIYAIDDNDENLDGGGEIESDTNQEVQIESWCKQENTIASFKCSQIKGNAQYPGYIALTNTHLWILREIPHNKGFARVVAKRPLDMIVQITSKRRQPESIIFRYGHSNLDPSRNSESGDQTDSTNKQQQLPHTLPEIVASDHFNIPQAFEVIRLVKREVVRIMDKLSRSTSETSENDKSPSENT